MSRIETKNCKMVYFDIAMLVSTSSTGDKLNQHKVLPREKVWDRFHSLLPEKSA